MNLVPKRKIGDGQQASVLGNMSIGGYQIPDASITNAKIANLAVGTAEIADLAVENAKIGLLAVDTAQIADAAIENAKIANLAVTNAKINDLDATKITAGYISVDRLEVGTITGAKLEDGTIADVKISDLDASKINAGYLSAARIEAGSIVASKLSLTGEWYNSSGVEIDATHGINIYGPTANALTTRVTKTGTIQCYVGADGELYAGAGAVKLDSTGLTIYGQLLKFYSGATYVGVAGAQSTTAMWIGAADTGIDLSLLSGNRIWAGRSILPVSAYDLGSVSYKWSILYATTVDLTGTGHIDLPVRSSHPTWAQGRMYYSSDTDWERPFIGRNSANFWFAAKYVLD